MSHLSEKVERVVKDLNVAQKRIHELTMKNHRLQEENQLQQDIINNLRADLENLKMELHRQASTFYKKFREHNL